MPLFGPPNVEKLKAKRDVKALIRALGYRKDVKVRRAAAAALGDVGGERAVDALISGLKDDDWQVCMAAAQSLGRIGGERAVDRLTETLELDDDHVRNRAASALAQIGDARAVEALVGALEHEERSVRRLASRSLGEIGEPRSVEPLTSRLRDTDSEVRWAAAVALGRIANPRAVDPLINALQDGNVPVAAARALGRIGDPRAVHALGAALEAGNRPLLAAVAEALGKIGAAPAVPALVDCFRKSTCWHQRSAPTTRDIECRSVVDGVRGALREIGTPAITPLTAWLEEEAGEVQEAAVWALEALQWQPDRSRAAAIYWITKRDWDKCVEVGPHAVGPLVAALHDRHGSVREGAAGALEVLGWGPADDEAGAAYFAVRQEWSRCLELGEPAVEPLIAALRWEDRTTRTGAARALAELYRSGRLGDLQKQSILAQRSTMTRKHTDARTDHLDRFTDCGPGPGHSDSYRGHEDTGIGLGFTP